MAAVLAKEKSEREAEVASLQVALGEAQNDGAMREHKLTNEITRLRDLQAISQPVWLRL